MAERNKVSVVFRDVVLALSALPVVEKRALSEDYGEFVFSNRDLRQWEEAITGVLGLPVKPCGDQPCAADENLTESFGGIRANQTLYKKDCGDSALLAMCWPWQDGAHITLKIFIT